MTRAAARRALAAWRAPSSGYVDPLCHPPAVRVLYGGPQQLSGLSARSRHALRGRVVAALTTSHVFNLRGVSRAHLAAAQRTAEARPRDPGPREHLVSRRQRRVAGIVEVRHGKVVAVGLADRADARPAGGRRCGPG